MADYFKNVMLIGATGDLGKFIFKALLDTTKTHPSQPINISVLTRQESNATKDLPSHITIHKGDFTSKEFLESAFKNQDIIISATSPYNLLGQKAMIDAAAAAGVKKFVLGEFGMDTKEKELTDAVRVFQQNRIVLEYAESKCAEPGINMKWTGIINGAFIDMCLLDGELGFDFEARKATLWNGGGKKIDVSLMADVADAVVGLIYAPDKYIDELAYISSFTVSQQDILASLRKMDGRGDWSVEEKPTSWLQEQGDKKIESGDMWGLVDELWAHVFAEGIGEPYTKVRRSANADLGIPEAGSRDFDETIKSILKEWDDGRRK